MNKTIYAGDQHQVDNGPNHDKKGSSSQPNQQGPQKSAQTAVNNPAPQTPKASRSDQEQEGLQNPAGDTRDVSREPVDHAEPLTKK